MSITFQLFFRICHQEGMEFNGTHHLLVYSDDINILVEIITTIKEHRSSVIG
jgi:hypothetical protein